MKIPTGIGPPQRQDHRVTDRLEKWITMAILTLPVRWYSNDTQHGELEIELERTAFMIVDSDCGTGNRYVEDGIAPALAAARAVGMRVVFIHQNLSSGSPVL